MKPETSTNTADANRVGSTGGSAVPSVALPLKLRLRGNDAWIEDASGREAVSRTCGFKSGAEHEQWLRWIVRTANATLQPNNPVGHEGAQPRSCL